MVALMLFDDQIFPMAPSAEEKRPVGEHIVLFQPVPPSGALKKRPVAGHEGRGGHAFGERIVRLPQSDNQGAFIPRLHSQGGQLRPALVDVLRP